MANSKNTSDSSRHWFRDFLSFLKTKKFWINLGLIFLFFAVIIFLSFQGLKIYTNHGEKLRMPDYIGKPLKMVTEDAWDRTFEVEIQDSVFIVGKPGNIVLNQNPKPENFVKEGRTIYLTVTKKQAEKVRIKELPRLYGENFDIKSNELKIGYKINTEVLGYAYDPGPENHILAVLIDGDTIITNNFRKGEVEIEKGGELQFILSEKKGGMVPLPDLKCMTYAEAKFLLSTFDLNLNASNTGAVSDLDKAWIIRQDPPYDPNQNIRMGSDVQVEVVSEKPTDCSFSENETPDDDQN